MDDAEIQTLESRLREARRARKASKAAARMNARHADPEFKAKLAASERGRLPTMTAAQRALYAKLRAAGIPRADAIAECMRETVAV